MTANTKSLLNHSKRQRKKALLYHSCDLQKDKDQQQNQLKECSNNNLSKEDDNAIIYKKFAVIGMATVDGNCSHFFEAAGEQEAYIKFARDAIGVSGTIAAGALALVDVSKEAIAALTLSTGAAYSVLDTYTKNFLFGSDNIHGVRTLIMNSLHVHHDAVMNDKSPWTFENSMRVILDHQEICRSSSIVHLVRAAIEKGNVVPMQLSKETDAQVAAVDRYYELLIASELGVSPGNVLRLDELAALYWYYVLTPSTDNEK